MSLDCWDELDFCFSGRPTPQPEKETLVSIELTRVFCFWVAAVKKAVEQIVDSIKQKKKHCLYHKVMEVHSSLIENNSFFNS